MSKQTVLTSVAGAIVLSVLTATASANGMHGHPAGGGRAEFHSMAPASRAFTAPRAHISERSVRGGFINHNLVRATPPTFVPRYPTTRYASPHYVPRVAHSFAPAWHRYRWYGGYWRGTYWPRASYYAGFPWFLAALPIGYTTFWFDSVPYYYANDAYYTWSDSDNGYVVTDPPPAAGDSGVADESSVSSEGSGRVFAYPLNGQSEQQQSTDIQECRDWAANHAAGDSAGASVTSTDFRRAEIACLTGRGYSAK